jgi:hypothetical protein
LNRSRHRQSQAAEPPRADDAVESCLGNGVEVRAWHHIAGVHVEGCREKSFSAIS